VHGADLFADAPERTVAHEPADCKALRTVAALCVAPNSGYKQMVGVECYDKGRDVRTFAGGMPVVAHPPCRTWSAYTAHQAKAPPGEKELGLLCAEWLRREGGGTGAPRALAAIRGRAPSTAWATHWRPVHDAGVAGVVGIPDAKGNVDLFQPR
jgi:hypothetical protein